MSAINIIQTLDVRWDSRTMFDRNFGGRLHPSKGHLFALESLPRLLDQFANLHWIVLGEGLQREKLEARAAELGVAQNVHFIGFRPDPLPYLAAADIYLRTPIFEADNLSSYQAVAMGLPVVGFDTGNENELIKRADNGILVPNRDSDALAKAISHILNLPDHGTAMGQRGAEFSHNHLDLRQMIEPLTTAYFALANSLLKPIQR
jgi:glycosyltransferase involved in cell wall biosynthesis